MSKIDPNVVPAAVMDCYRRGLQRMEAGDHAYAHFFLSQCVLNSPSCEVFASALLKNLSRAKARPTKFSFFKLSTRRQRVFDQTIQRGQWKEAIRLGVDLLSRNPWDVKALRGMAMVCASLHHYEVELVYLKQALDADPKNVDVSRHCATSLARMGQFDQAIACWHRIETLRGGDEEAAKAISLLSMERLKHPAGRTKVAPTADNAKQRAASVGKKAETPAADARQAPMAASTRINRPTPSAVTEPERLEHAPPQSNAVQSATSALRKSNVQRTAKSTLAISRKIPRLRLPWMELALVAASVALAVQLFPDAAAVVWASIDIRLWSVVTWIMLLVTVAVAVCVLNLRRQLTSSQGKKAE